MSYQDFEPEISKLWYVFWIVVIAIIFGLLAAVAESEGAQVESNYVVVETGDSLSAIAKEVYGDYQRWPELQKLNGLKGTIIYPGQKIYFALELSEKAKFELANAAIYDRMREWFKRRHGFHGYTLKDTTQEWAVAPIVGQRSPQLHYNIVELKRRIEWTDLAIVKTSITAVARKPEHVMLLAALAEQESGYRNLYGSHTEIGPFQIKPTTAAHFLRSSLPTETIEYIESWLEDIPSSTFTAYTILKGLGLDRKPLREVLENYNGGSQKKSYADEVLRRYGRIRAIYNKTVLEKQRKTMK